MGMTRYEYITRQLYKDLPEEEITEIIDRDAKIMLKRIVKPEILSELQREINRASDIGVPLTYEAMLEKAHFEEQLLTKNIAKKTQKASKPNPPKPERALASFLYDEIDDEEEIDDEPQHEIEDERPPNRYHDENEDEQDYWAERRRY